jgi:dihydrofolate reductase
MTRLTYLLNVSLDGFVETPDHSLDWAVVDAELHSWFNDRQREVEASLYGRRLYETMAAYWPTGESNPDSTPEMREFARLWLETPKIVFSSTLREVDWNSRLVRGDVASEWARLRTEFHGDVDVGGATLAASFIRAGLVDEYRLVIHPVAIGAGTPFFPKFDSPLRLHLAETHQFASGVLYARYVPSR